jgi:hypothetical protein
MSSILQGEILGRSLYKPLGDSRVENFPKGISAAVPNLIQAPQQPRMPAHANEFNTTWHPFVILWHRVIEQLKYERKATY